MTVLVTGGSGQVGTALRAELPDGVFTESSELDITDREALAVRDWTGTTAIINTAAWTAVDLAEQDDRLLRAWDVNVTGVANLAWHARRLGIPLVHISSDYVLRGDHTGDAPVEAPLDPQGMYGTGKAASELAARIAPRHFVVRTSWVFGEGPNFVRTMRRLGASRPQLTVVDDQVGRPTYAVDLARALVRLLDADLPPGTYHATGAGQPVSWAGFARAVLAGTDCQVLPVTTDEYRRGAPAMAARPANSALSGGVLPMRDWRAALQEYLAKEEERA